MHRSHTQISVVVPVFNSAEVLPRLVERVCQVLTSMGHPYELIFVEDGSRDDSWAVLSHLQEQYADRLTAVQLMRNFGQHNALMCGFRHANGRYVVTLDDDLQNPPEEIPKLLKVIEARELDVVYGSYRLSGGKKHDRWRNMASAASHLFYRTVFRTRVNTTSFRIIRREVLESILTYSLNYTYIDGLLAWTSERIGEVPVEHHPRSSGRSGYSAGKLLLLALNLFTNFSLLPLQLVSMLGVLVAMAGFTFGIFYLVQRLFANIAIPGFATIIIAVLILGGHQMLSLGIIGEYLGRLHMNVNRKPQYVERTVRLLSAVERSHSAAPSAASDESTLSSP